MQKNGKPMRKLRNEELNRPTVAKYRSSTKIPVIIILDNVRSMNNVGSVFRTCDAFLIKELYLCGITAQPPHREINKTALGATESVQWSYFRKTQDAVEKARSNNFHVVGVEQTTSSVPLQSFKPDHQVPHALIFGNEFNGIDQNIIDVCDTSIVIPQFGTKHSLNIAVSAGIVIWHFYRAFR
jgi:tRNA G18 (ribose-2'-O)-methylase SpoU